MKLSRRKIHTSTKWMIANNIIPKEYLIRLNKSQISRYRKINFKEYFGSELFPPSDNIIYIARNAASNKFDRSVINAYLRLAITSRNVISSGKYFHRLIKTNKELIVDLVQRIRNVVPIKTSARFLGLSESSLRNWITENRVRCADSLLNTCRKVHPNQLLPPEIDSMKRLLLNPDFRFWPLRSIYYYAMHNKLISMGQSTWYKYALLLNISRLKPFSVKKYGHSVRASKPNEYWHADVTYYKTRDGVTNYIYTVVDNYSKCPLAVSVSAHLSGAIRVETFREAFRFALNANSSMENIKLIVDGGSENFNGTVDEFLADPVNIDIKRIRALKDVVFSNSQAEAFNRILKCNYLNHYEIENTSGLAKIVEKSWRDFAFKRPHGALKGLIPHEVLSGKRPDQVSFKSQIRQSRKMRTKINPGLACKGCNFKN